MENGWFIVDSHMKDGDSPIVMLVYWRLRQRSSSLKWRWVKEFQAASHSKDAALSMRCAEYLDQKPHDQCSRISVEKCSEQGCFMLFQGKRVFLFYSSPPPEASNHIHLSRVSTKKDDISGMDSVTSRYVSTVQWWYMNQPLWAQDHHKISGSLSDRQVTWSA
jgi:hypothetical protein